MAGRFWPIAVDGYNDWTSWSRCWIDWSTSLEYATDANSADDVFRKYRESNGIEVSKKGNEGKISTNQDDKYKLDKSLSTEQNTNNHKSLNIKNILIQTIYFISTFWVFAGFTLSYASYISYLTLFLITLIVYIAIYKINIGNYSTSIKKTTYWLLFGGVFMLVIVMEINPFIQRTFEFIGNSYKYGSCSVGRFFSSPPKLNLTSGERATKELYDNAPKNISPIYLNRLFTEGTDLQKTNAEKSITGQIVKWKLQVKNVSYYTRYSVEILTKKGAVDNRSEKWKSFYNEVDMFFKDAMDIDSSFSSGGGRYDNQNVEVNIILDLDSHEASYLNSLKEGDWIVVRGKIDDVIGDRVRLSPAVLENNFSMSLYEFTKNKVNQHKVDYQKYNEGSCKFKSSGNTLKTATEKPSDDVNEPLAINNSDSDDNEFLALKLASDPRVMIKKYFLKSIDTLQSYSGDINNPRSEFTIRWKIKDGSIQEIDSIGVSISRSSDGEYNALIGKFDYILAHYKLKYLNNKWEITSSCEEVPTPNSENVLHKDYGNHELVCEPISKLSKHLEISLPLLEDYQLSDNSNRVFNSKWLPEGLKIYAFSDGQLFYQKGNEKPNNTKLDIENDKSLQLGQLQILIDKDNLYVAYSYGDGEDTHGIRLCKFHLNKLKKQWCSNNEVEINFNLFKSSNSIYLGMSDFKLVKFDDAGAVMWRSNKSHIKKALIRDEDRYIGSSPCRLVEKDSVINVYIDDSSEVNNVSKHYVITYEKNSGLLLKSITSEGKCPKERTDR